MHICSMVHSDRLLVTLIRSYAAARGISVSYASRLLTGSGDTVDRVTAGASVTARRAETILRRASRALARRPRLARRHSTPGARG